MTERWLKIPPKQPLMSCMIYDRHAKIIGVTDPCNEPAWPLLLGYVLACVGFGVCFALLVRWL